MGDETEGKTGETPEEVSDQAKLAHHQDGDEASARIDLTSNDDVVRIVDRSEVLEAINAGKVIDKEAAKRMQSAFPGFDATSRGQVDGATDVNENDTATLPTSTSSSASNNLPVSDYEEERPLISINEYGDSVINLNDENRTDPRRTRVDESQFHVVQRSDTDTSSLPNLNDDPNLRRESDVVMSDEHSLNEDDNEDDPASVEQHKNQNLVNELSEEGKVVVVVVGDFAHDKNDFARYEEEGEGLSEDWGSFGTEGEANTDLASNESESVTDEQAGNENAAREVSQQPNNSSGSDAAQHESVGEAAEALVTSPSFVRRVLTGLLVSGAALAMFAAGPVWTLLFITAGALLAAVELFDAFRRVGYRPATMLALVGVVGAMFGAYARGEAALTLVLALVVLFSFLWYLTGIITVKPTVNIAVTLLGFVWTGLMASFAAIMLRAPNRHGIAFILGGVLVTAAYDISAYFGGSLFGRRALLPAISPSKTWEGVIAGTIGAMVISVGLVHFIHPWTFVATVLLGLTVSVVAPIGDLAESLIKRDLGLKDMSHMLPGHGGVFDRIDALLFVMPATYFLVQALGLA